MTAVPNERLAEALKQEEMPARPGQLPQVTGKVTIALIACFHTLESVLGHGSQMGG